MNVSHVVIMEESTVPQSVCMCRDQRVWRTVLVVLIGRTEMKPLYNTVHKNISSY